MNALTSENSYPTRASLRRATRPVAVAPRAEYPAEGDAPLSDLSAHESLAMFGLTAPTPVTAETVPLSAVTDTPLTPAAVGTTSTPTVAERASTPTAAVPAATRPLPTLLTEGAGAATRVRRTAILEVGLREPAAAEASGTAGGANGGVAAGARGGDAGAQVRDASAEEVAGSAVATSTVPKEADPDLVSALMQVVEMRGSDLHITGNAGPTLRVDGRLRQIEGTAAWSREKVRAALLSVLTEQQRESFAQVLELDFALTLASGARFRVNLYQQRGAIGGAFRLVPTQILPLDELGVPETIGKFAALPRGLVLVTGPTGSGKSTTLAALIDLVNRTRADHIVTVEDPIEFLHSHKKSLVNQREVGTDTHSFAAALKHVLRQDPDVILIGELRDLETIAVALTAAETGHLVFATLHTQDAAQSIDRLIDVFPPFQQAQVRAQLAATLQGVVCQMLLRRADGEGRVVATEVLVTTPAIANLIREGRTHQIRSAMQAGRELGMHTSDQRLAELVNLGTITHAAAYEKAQDVGDLRRMIQREEPAGSGGSLAVGGVDFGDSYSAVGPTR
jgi:twitching motility protein PilT